MSDSQQPPQQRSRTPEPPYCWQSKAARRIIYEYFDGDTGRGLGASHQTGWTALIALLLQQYSAAGAMPAAAAQGAPELAEVGRR